MSAFSDASIRCSFCARTAREAASIVAGPDGGPDVYICDECVDVAAGIMQIDRMPHRNPSPASGSPPQADRATAWPLPPPEIKARLDAYIVGQHQAKKTLAVAVYNHYKRITPPPPRVRALSAFDDVEVEKSNVLLVGPTGTGKTLLARTLARILDVPFCVCDATALTEAGYVGEDVESILAHLLRAADFDAEAAACGIIYLDEIDKVARKADNVSITRDVSGEGVQQALLKLLEGTIASVPPEGGRKHPEQPLVEVNTRNILFICGGAFDGLAPLIARRRSQRTVGFHAAPALEQAAPEASPSDPADADEADFLRHVEPEDLLRFGLIPELVGRLPVVAALHPLSDADMKRILIDPKNALVRQYRKLFALDGAHLVFEEAALDAIVEEAQERGTGARGLRSVMERVLRDVMFDLHERPSPSTCRITTATVHHDAEPIFEKRRASA